MKPSFVKFLLTTLIFLIPTFGEAREPKPQHLQENNCEEFENSETTLYSSDSVGFSIATDLLYHSGPLARLLERNPNTEIDFESIDAATLTYIIEYLRNENNRVSNELEAPLVREINDLLDKNDLDMVCRICEADPNLLVKIYNGASKLELDYLKKICIAAIVQLEKVNQANFSNLNKITSYPWHKMTEGDLITDIASFSPAYLKNFLNLFWNKSGLTPL